MYKIPVLLFLFRYVAFLSCRWCTEERQRDTGPMMVSTLKPNHEAEFKHAEVAPSRTPAHAHRERIIPLKEFRQQVRRPFTYRGPVRTDSKLQVPPTMIHHKLRTPKTTGEYTISRNIDNNTDILIFLFLLETKLNHVALWRKFFLNGFVDGRPQHLSFAHFAHPVTGSAASLQKLNITVVPTTLTTYCFNLLSAQWMLLGRALAATAFHRGRTMFIFVSHTTVPLRPLHQMREILFKSGKSNWCTPSPASFPWMWIRRGRDRTGLVRHSQWIILNRTDAQRSVAAGAMDQGIGKWKFPRMGWDGFANLTTISYMGRRYIPGCMDESHINFVHGLWEKSKQDLWRGLDRSCRTWVHWDPSGNSSHPDSFQGDEPEVSKLLKSLSTNGFFFARKFNRSEKLNNFFALV